ncbi:hypothetical protein KJ855_03035, partial [Patescibacteria group bacterium]|nr:hypothetical protein [Patescibacteria group bacterium]
MSTLINKIKSQLSNPRSTIWILIIFYILLSLLALRGVLFNTETIGFRHDWAIAAKPEEIQLWLQHALFPWIDARGGFSIAYLSDFIIRLTFGLLGYVGVGGNFLSKFFIIVPLIFSGLFSFLFINRIIKTNRVGAILGSVLFTFNPLTFNKIIAGHTNYLIAYSLSFLFLYLIFRYFDQPALSHSRYHPLYYLLLAGLIFAICGVQVQFPILLIICLIVLALIYHTPIKKILFSLFFICLTAFFIHLPWLMTFALEAINYQFQIASSPTLFSWFVHNSSDLFAAYFMTGGGADYFSITLKDYNFYALWLIVACVTLFAIIINLQTKHKQYRYIFVFFLFSVFLLSLSKIFPEISFHLLNQSIIFSVFREVYHSSVLIAISSSILFAICYHNLFQSSALARLKYIYPIIVFLFVLPFFIDGKLLGNLQTYSQSYQYQTEINTNSRVLYLPSLQPLNLPDHPHSGFDTSIYYSPSTSLGQSVYFNSLNDRFSTYLQSQLYFNSDKLSQVLDRYLDLLNIDYIIYRPNIVSEHDQFTLLANYPDKLKSFTNDSLQKVLTQYDEQIIDKKDDWTT